MKKLMIVSVVVGALAYLHRLGLKEIQRQQRDGINADPDSMTKENFGVAFRRAQDPRYRYRDLINPF